MKDWATYKLSDIAVFKNGRSRPASTGKIPVYGGNGILGYADESNSKGEVIVVGRVGAYCGSTYYEDRPIWISDNAMYALPKENFNTKFLYYLLKNLKLNKYAQGSSHPLLTQTILNGIETLFTEEIDQQQEVSSILSSLDDKIQLNLQMNKTLEAIAETLFEEWFNSKEQESWKTVHLGDLIEIKGGFSYEGKYIGDGDAVLLGMGCVSFEERFLFSGARPYSGEGGNNHLVNPGDIVIATRQQSDNLPILGFPAKVPSSLKEKRVIVGTNLYKVINKTSLNASLLFQLFRSVRYRKHILSSSKGTTVRMITKDAIEHFEIKLPPEQVLSQYEVALASLDRKIEVNTEQIQTLVDIRDTILPKLISGKIQLNA